jgi:hypothetical protein
LDGCSDNHFLAQLALVQIASGIAQGVISKQLEDRSRLTGKPITVTVG